MITAFHPTRDQVIALAQQADDATLALMFEAATEYQQPLELSEAERAELMQIRQRRLDGEQGTPAEEVIARIKARNTHGKL